MKTREELIKHYVAMISKHSREVYNLMLFLLDNKEKLSLDLDDWDIIERAYKHDIDKINRDYVNAVIDVYYFSDTKNSTEMARLESTIREHKLEQPHHVQCHDKNCTPISDIDICEMCCDWVSSVKRHQIVDDEVGAAKEFYFNRCEDFPILKEKENKFLEVFDLLNNYSA